MWWEAIAALASFGAPLTGIAADDPANPGKFFRFGKEPIVVDVLPSIDGVDFDAAWDRRVEGAIDDQSGLTAFFISKNDPIASKLTAGRARDLADVEEIPDAETSQS